MINRAIRREDGQHTQSAFATTAIGDHGNAIGLKGIQQCLVGWHFEGHAQTRDIDGERLTGKGAAIAKGFKP